MKMSKVKYFLGFGVCMLLSGLALTIETPAEQEIKTIVSTCMDQVRRRVPDECRKIDTLCKRYGVDLVPYLEEYLTNTNELVRWQAYSWMILIGIDANDVLARQSIVHKLLIRLRDDEYFGNKQYLSSRLLQFTSADFSTEAKELLRDQFSNALVDRKMNGYARGDIILLVGVADMKSELPLLKEFIEQREDKLIQEHKKSIDNLENLLERIPEERKARRNTVLKMLKKQYWQDTLMWQALRTRARMGVKEDILRCIDLVESHPDEDYRVASLLGQLAYVRQPEILNYLQKYLNSDKLESYKGYDTIRKSYAQRAAMAISTMLYGFPGNADYGGNQETIEQCRKWMTEQTKLKLIR